MVTPIIKVQPIRFISSESVIRFCFLQSFDSDAVCNKLHDDLIYAVPLAAGVRIAVCAVPSRKIKGMAEKTLKAMKNC